MRTIARFRTRTVQPMLVALPFGLFAMSVAFDGIALATRASGGAAHASIWSLVAAWDLAAGLVLGAVAGLFAMLDLLRADRFQQGIGRDDLVRGGLELAVLALFSLSFVLRAAHSRPLPVLAAFVCSAAGLVLALLATVLTDSRETG